jgi:leucyl aminopeptidase
VRIPEENVNQALAAAGLWGFFAPELVIYGSKDSPRVSELAAMQADTPGAPRLLLFVGDEPAERAQALQEHARRT